MLNSKERRPTRQACVSAAGDASFRCGSPSAGSPAGWAHLLQDPLAGGGQAPGGGSFDGWSHHPPRKITQRKHRVGVRMFGMGDPRIHAEFDFLARDRAGVRGQAARRLRSHFNIARSMAGKHRRDVAVQDMAAAGDGPVRPGRPHLKVRSRQGRDRPHRLRSSFLAGGGVRVRESSRASPPPAIARSTRISECDCPASGTSQRRKR